MATQTSTVPAYLDALQAALEARHIAATQGGEIVVTTAPSGAPVPLETIQFFGTNGDQAWAALGNRRRKETYTIRGGIYIQKAGYGEATAKAARNRAYDLLAELEDCLRLDPGVGLTVRQSELLTADLDQGIAEGSENEAARYATIALTIGVAVELVSN